ncbi:Mo-dependent nitrogenase C-terminal domain-containing protein [Synechococcus sp. C9]|uniref:Mo-dependent nitrogenase C-terminal domain-containing protein n=1 Tax=Synechococcus sp. C9 TaxID=102119 RepID=UPI001FF25A66|nr:Mo-dependent nitrogenase C-terminal domain-containing protein [Synechococcus sp. C9]
MHTLVFETPKDWLYPLRQALNGIQVTNSRTAHWICRLIPSRCPFERTFYVAGKKIHIPPLCQLNPLYNEVVALRLRALDYLTALEIDVTPYLEP